MEIFPRIGGLVFYMAAMTKAMMAGTRLARPDSITRMDYSLTCFGPVSLESICWLTGLQQGTLTCPWGTQWTRRALPWDAEHLAQ
ncbi:hypothetical protein PoB_006511000 [Plakobranchus ocellatus]|uniref:Uncharacterized protein n=1 Tax=Plakobranchus ocellatus TaxID=259542 RepID=A0AAV4D397_9GAST|nr:hypothetical protein PoB_006511000 [Plakobranchus ocellatus]